MTSSISSALLILAVVATANGILFATKIVQHEGEELPENVRMPDHIRLRRSTAAPQPHCHRHAIRSACSAEEDQDDVDACITETCTACILTDASNPFASFCPRLTACVCSVINDPRCFGIVASDCY